MRLFIDLIVLLCALSSISYGQSGILYNDSTEVNFYCKYDGVIVVSKWMRVKHGEKAWYEKVGGWFAGWFTDESKPRFRGPPDPKSVARENAADEKGLMLMAEAGYDPQAAVSFWTRYYERTGWWEGDGTHPKPRERLAHLNALMPKAKKIYLSAFGNKAILVSTTPKKGTP